MDRDQSPDPNINCLYYFDSLFEDKPPPMNFQQLRSVQETMRQNLNLTQVALALHTSQPGVSKQIRELEDELGVQIFVRNGKRLTGLTPPGRAVLHWVERVLAEQQNLKRAAADFAQEKTGTLTIGTTHTQARYSLPPAIRAFKRRYPLVELSIIQGTPSHIAALVMDGQADVCIATETIAQHPGLVGLPCHRWHHIVVTPAKHPLLALKKPSLKDLAQYPIVTYDGAFAGRSTINQAFATAGLEPHVVLSAVDSDVIKTYVELDLGIGILAGIAFDEMRDKHLRAIDTGHLFPEKTTYLAMRKGAYLRGFAYDFIELFAPTLKRDVVERALKKVK